MVKSRSFENFWVYKPYFGLSFGTQQMSLRISFFALLDFLCGCVSFGPLTLAILLQDFPYIFSFCRYLKIHHLITIIVKISLAARGSAPSTAAPLLIRTKMCNITSILVGSLLHSGPQDCFYTMGRLDGSTLIETSSHEFKSSDEV